MHKYLPVFFILSSLGTLLYSASIQNDYTTFKMRFQQTLTGNMVHIGNTILVAPTDQDSNCSTYTNAPYIKSHANAQTNTHYTYCAYWVDDTVSFPTTRAQLPLGENAREIVWAGLYWQSLVPNGTPLNNMQVKIKSESTTSYTSSPYHSIPYDSLSYKIDAAHTGYTSYAAYADVTSYFKNNILPNSYITLGDIPTYEGKIDTVGTYGGWSLAVIYKDDTQTLQNFTIYDGWEKVSPTAPPVEMTLSGFMTPKQPADNTSLTMTSTLSLFAMGSDQALTDDSLQLKSSQRTTPTILSHTRDQTFHSAIVTTTPFERTPTMLNAHGIDLQEFNIGSDGYNLLDPQENSLKVTFSSNNDTYWPSMLALRTQLYLPKLCYDYTVRLGEYHLIPTTDRTISIDTLDESALYIQFALRSQEADFIYFDTKANITFAPNTHFTYNRNYVAMSPPSSHTYFKLSDGYHEIEHNRSIGQIAIGDNVIGIENNNGGALTPNKTTYAVLGYDISSIPDTAIHFDFQFDTKIQFHPDTLPVDYHFNTSVSASNTVFIDRCPTNQIYDPLYRQFNVERIETQSEPLSSRYTLHTQVAQRPYQLDITSYHDLNTSNGLHIPKNFNGTLEVEVINAQGFKNDASAGYDMTCDSPDVIGEGSLIAFNSNNTQSRRTINIPQDLPYYDDTVVLQEAAIRLWIIAVPDDNNVQRIIAHQCTDKTNSDHCFSDLYTQSIDTNATGKCTLACTQNNPQCYECLKNHYAFSVCSRDNFSIRPASYQIQISDAGDNNLSNLPIALGNNQASQTNNTIRLAAEYPYLLEINATNYHSTSVSKRYTTQKFISKQYTRLPTLKLNHGSIAAIEFNDAQNCYDHNSSTLALKFKNSILSHKTTLMHDNVGNYTFWLADSNWTAVDQVSSGLKPIFDNTPVDDCIPNSAQNTPNEMAGCTIYSIHENDTLPLHLHFQPYFFDLNIGLRTSPLGNYLFLNDLSHPYYADTILHPIDMVAILEGNITAKGKQNTLLTNYSTGCAATDIRLNVSLSSTPPTQLPLQLKLSSLAGEHLRQTTLNTQSDINLSHLAFSDTLHPGSANITLYSTLKKPFKTLSNTSPELNPIVVTYNEFKVWSDDAFSDTNLTTFIPKGLAIYDSNITYVYGKIIPEQTLYDNVTPNSIRTKLYLGIYCDETVSSCQKHHLSSPMHTLTQTQSSAWYLADMFQNTAIGESTLTVSTYAGNPADPYISSAYHPKAKKLDNVTFNSPSLAKNEDLNISIMSEERPSVIKIKYDPVAWLDYDIKEDTTTQTHNDSDYYRVKFIGERGWAGVGDTGMVTQSPSSLETRTRMRW